jgi:hypothetical protein
MVLIEKALSFERQNTKRDTGVFQGSVKNRFKPYLLKLKENSGHKIDNLSARLTNFKTNMANLVSLGSEPGKLSNQLTITIEKTSLKNTRLSGGFDLDTKLYNMEPNAGPEKRIELGIDLYDIESDWKD